MTPLPLGSLARLVAVALTLTGFAYGEASVNEAPLPQETAAPAGDHLKPSGEADANVVVRFVEFDGELPPELQEYFGATQGVMLTEKAEAVFKTMDAIRIGKLGKRQRVSLRFGQTETVSKMELSYPGQGNGDGVGITVGGVERKLQVRTTGMALALHLIDARKENVVMKATLDHTSFKGFVEYTSTRETISTNSQGQPVKTWIKVPSGFYQPIFETTSREEALTLAAGQTVFLRLDWTESKIRPAEGNDQPFDAENQPMVARSALIFIGLDQVPKTH